MTQKLTIEEMALTIGSLIKPKACEYAINAGKKAEFIKEYLRAAEHVAKYISSHVDQVERQRNEAVNIGLGLVGTLRTVLQETQVGGQAEKMLSWAEERLAQIAKGLP